MKKTVWLWVLVVLLIVSSILFIRQQFVIEEQKEKLEDIQKEIETVEQDSEELKENISNAESKEAIENIAREELGLVYPDERKFVDSNG